MKRALSMLAIVLGGCSSCEEPRSTPPAATTEATPEATTEVPEAPTAPSEATPDRPALPTPTRSDATRRADLLAQGRQLERDGDHEAAVARYRSALEIAPGDATILGELGWALFHANRFDEAVDATNDALERVATDREEGMLLYNLGRIAEAMTHTGAAIAFYRRSLALRPNETVRARIVALHGEPPSPGEVPIEDWVHSFAVTDPPVATLADVCDALAPGWRADDEDDDESDDESDDEEYDEGMSTRCTPELTDAATGESGVLEAGIVHLVGRDMSDDDVLVLVARTARGWFVVNELCSNYYGPSSMNGGECGAEVEVEDVIAGGPLELVVHVSEDTTWAEWCEGGGAQTESMLVCGVLGEGFGCYLDTTLSRSERHGTWQQGEGWAGVGLSEDDDEICSDHDTVEADLDEASGANLREQTISVDIDAAGVVTFDGTEGEEDRVRPTALASPVDLRRLPCIAATPDPAFGCPPPATTPTPPPPATH